MGGSRWPRGCLPLERLDDRVPAERLLEREGPVDPRQAGPVRQEVRHRHVLLSGLGELGPIRRHRRLHVDCALLSQPVGAHRGNPLGGRVDEHHRVLVPRPPGLRVGNTPPEVDDLLPPVVGTKCCAGLESVVEVGLERVAHLFETGRGPSLDCRHSTHHPPFCLPRRSSANSFAHG